MDYIKDYIQSCFMTSFIQLELLQFNKIPRTRKFNNQYFILLKMSKLKKYIINVDSIIL